MFLLACKELETRLRTWQARSLYFWSSHSKCSGTISNRQRLFIVVGFLTTSLHILECLAHSPWKESFMHYSHIWFPPAESRGVICRIRFQAPSPVHWIRASRVSSFMGRWFGDDVGLAITGPVTRVKQMTLGLGCMHYSRVETKLCRCQKLKRTGTSANCAFGRSCFLEGNFTVI